MQRKEFLKYHDEFCGRMRKVVGQKNADYAGAGNEFAFANFCQIEVDGLASTEVGLWTRFRDKTSRLLTFIKGGVFQVADEKVEDTILDACNYLIILAAYIKYKRELQTPKIDHLATELGHANPDVHVTRSFQDEIPSPDVQFDPWHCEKKTEMWNTELGQMRVTYGATR